MPIFQFFLVTIAVVAGWLSSYQPIKTLVNWQKKDFNPFKLYTWGSQSGAMYVFLIVSRDEVKNTLMAPLRDVHISNVL